MAEGDMDASSKTVEITAQCLCKAHTFSTRVSESSLPLESTACHCNSCRHATGSLCLVSAIWPQPKENVDIGGLKSYQFSANVTTRFCGTCSTPMFYETPGSPSELGVFTGALRNIDADLVRITQHIFVGDTLDGGASVWLRKPNPDGKEIPRYREYSEEIPWSLPEAPAHSSGSDAEEITESLPVSCHCKGVQLLFHQGTYASKKREELPWHIDPRNNKHTATFDACNSCRLQFGTDIVYWTYGELVTISQRDGGAFPRTATELKAAVDAGDAAIGTLTYYRSSPDVQRYSCKVCSASVFYACDDRPDMVDVGIGLLESPDGARAEKYLSWSFGSPLGYIEDTNGGWREGLAKRVQAEAEEFRIARGYPKSWRRIQKEAEEASS